MAQSLAINGLQPTEEKISPVVDYYLTTIFLQQLFPASEYAPVAQLDRVSDSDSEGRWFESSRAYHKIQTV